MPYVLIGGADSQRVAFNALPATDGGGTAITWRFSVQGYQSDGSTTKNNVCQLVSSDPTSADHRKVEDLSGATGGDICRVSVVGEATGKTNYEGVESLDLPVLGELDYDASVDLTRVPYSPISISIV